MRSLIMLLWYLPKACVASQMALCGLTDKGITAHEVHTLSSHSPYNRGIISLLVRAV